MAGKWQVRALAVLAQRSPLRWREIRWRTGAVSRAEMQACKRALRTLVAYGVLARQARGVYALRMPEAVVLEHLRTLYKPRRRKEEACP